MPRSFDPIEAEKIATERREETSKLYVEVIVSWLHDGRLRPLSFVWENGSEYRIDKIIAVRKGHSLKVFAGGLRYYCQTGNRQYYLHYDSERWYIETKNKAPRNHLRALSCLYVSSRRIGLQTPVNLSIVQVVFYIIVPLLKLLSEITLQNKELQPRRNK